MAFFTALLICFAIKLTYEVDPKCPTFVECPCGSKGENFSICVSDGIVNAEMCANLSNCQSCEDGSNVCSKCPEGFEGPFCTLGTPDKDLTFCRDPGINTNSFRRPSTLPTCHGFSLDSRLEYSCEEGFELNGERSLFCLSSGEWTASAPRCVEKSRTSRNVVIYCPDPGINANSLRRPSTLPTLRGFIQGSQLEYSCEEDYRLSGKQRLVCQVSGKWTSSVPRCFNQSSTTDTDELEKENPCGNGDKILCFDLGGGYKCMRYVCPTNYYRDSDFVDTTCRHVIKICPLNDSGCLVEPRFLNHYCFTLNSNTTIPKSGRFEIIHSSPSLEEKDEYTLQVKAVKASTGVTPATRNNFEVKNTAEYKQMVSLTKSIQGPQEIELNLIKKTFRNGTFHLNSISKIFIFVSEL